MSLPNLLVIGAMKAGTTSFHEMLSRHPDIFMSEIKELNFFCSTDSDRQDIEAYARQFIKGLSNPVRGESSVNYSKRHRFPGVASRVSRILGNNIKLIYILRDPVQRFRSNFIDSKTYGDIPAGMDINSFIVENQLEENPFVLTGCYAWQLEPYAKLFPLMNIHLIEFEELISRPDVVLKKVFAFLGLEYFETGLSQINRSSEKEYLTKTGQRLKGWQQLKEYLPIQIRESLKESAFLRKILFQKADSKVNELSEISALKLQKVFIADVKQLKRKFGFTPNHWNWLN